MEDSVEKIEFNTIIIDDMWRTSTQLFPIDEKHLPFLTWKCWAHSEEKNFYLQQLVSEMVFVLDNHERMQHKLSMNLVTQLQAPHCTTLEEFRGKMMLQT